MFVFWMVLVGLIVGVGAALLLHARGYATSITLAIVGSCAAALLARSLGWIHGPMAGGGIVVAACGAVVALAVYGVASRPLAPGRR